MPSIPTPEAFLAECLRRGIKLTAQDGAIKASGKPPANPQSFIRYVKAKKPELIALLTTPDIASLVARSGAGEVPAVELSPLQSPPDDWRTPERIAWEMMLCAIAEGRKLVHWPRCNDWGHVLDPVYIRPGTTTEDPERYFSKGWKRYCQIWHKAQDARPGDKRAYATLARDRDALFDELRYVVSQSQDLPTAADDPYPGESAPPDEYRRWVVREVGRIRCAPSSPHAACHPCPARRPRLVRLGGRR